MGSVPAVFAAKTAMALEGAYEKTRAEAIAAEAATALTPTPKRSGKTETAKSVPKPAADVTTSPRRCPRRNTAPKIT